MFDFQKRKTYTYLRTEGVHFSIQMNKKRYNECLCSSAYCRSASKQTTTWAFGVYMAQVVTQWNWPMANETFYGVVYYNGHSLLNLIVILPLVRFKCQKKSPALVRQFKVVHRRQFLWIRDSIKNSKLICYGKKYFRTFFSNQ